MPSIPLFLERSDVDHLLAVLSADPDVAFLEDLGAAIDASPLGSKRWRATRTYVYERDGEVAIWHMPSGPVMVSNTGPDGPAGMDVQAAFDGWIGPAYSNKPEMPMLGNRPQFFQLQIEIRSARHPDQLGLSSISWIGSRYERAPEAATSFWKKLQRLARRGANTVLGDGISSDAECRFLCWPAAYQRLCLQEPGRL